MWLAIGTNACLLHRVSIFVNGDDDKLCSNCLEEYAKLIDAFPQCKVYHTRTWQINPQSEIIGITGPRPVWESVYDNILNGLNCTGHNIFQTICMKHNT